jgi:hypothetical protein
MKPVSHMVVYQDGQGEPTRIFGPFASISIAQYFKAELPTPLPGGQSKIVPTQPFTINEGHIVNRKILSERRETVRA